MKRFGLPLLIGAVIVVWAVSGLILSGNEQRGTFGDMFGMVDALFSGLAFALIIYTLILLKNELISQRLEIEQARRELSGQKDILHSQKQVMEDHQNAVRSHTDIIEDQKTVTQDQANALQAQKVALDDQKTVLENQYSALSTHSVWLEGQSSLLENQNALLENHNIWLESQSTLLESHNIWLENQSTLLESQNKVLEGQYGIFQKQQDTLNLQNTALSDLNERLALQSFENTFFQMMKLHNELLNSIDLVDYGQQGRQEVHAGRDSFMRAWRAYGAQFYENAETVDSETRRQQLIDAYSKLWESLETEFGHYFRSLYYLIKFVDDAQISNKQQYTNTVRAQLSVQEMLLIFYNGIYHSESKFNTLIEKYALMKYLPVSTVPSALDFTFFDANAFGGAYPAVSVVADEPDDSQEHRTAQEPALD